MRRDSPSTSRRSRTREEEAWGEGAGWEREENGEESGRGPGRCAGFAQARGGGRRGQEDWEEDVVVVREGRGTGERKAMVRTVADFDESGV